MAENKDCITDSQPYISEIQSHMLGLVVTIMNSYGLTLQYVIDRFEYIAQQSNPSLADPSKNSVIAKDNLLYVSNRRNFRDMLTKGIKICPQYSGCDNAKCIKFHVKKENLCPHAGRDNYCNQSDCDKIIIKTCREGARCKDTSSCSFKH